MKLKLTTKIFIGLFLGVLVGLMLQSNSSIAMTYIKPFGDLFINLIKMLIVPLVLSSLIVGASSIGDIKTLGKIGGKTLLYYLFTTAFAVSIGLLLGKLFNAGIGISMPVEAVAQEAKQAPSLISTLLNVVPKNNAKVII